MILASIAAAAWIALLWYAAPIVGGDGREPADRLAGTLVLGVLVPFALGMLHALAAPGLFAVACALCILRRWRHAPSRLAERRPQRDRAAVALVVFAVVAAAWPALVRPLLEGDSLAYHLPNAAAWVRAGSLWDASTRYWWYPGGSELFAAGLYAVSGPFSLGLSGTLAALLLGLRIVAWGRRCGVEPLLAGAAGAATLATLTVGLQAGNLQNDVWLAAFFVEMLFDARYAPRKLGGDAAVCVLVKPYGWAFAAYAAIASRRPDRWMLLPLVAGVLWAVRDAVLWSRAVIPPGSIAFPAIERTTVLGNGLGGLVELAGALAHDGPWMVVLALAPFAGAFLLKDRWLCVAGIVAFLAFLALPFSYGNAVAQLASGQSLRYALPALALGAIAAMLLLRRSGILGAAVLLVVAAAGLHRIAAIFWIDPHTRDAVFAAAALAAATMLVAQPWASLVTALVAAMLIVGAAANASRDAVARYDELLLPQHTRVFDWLAHRRLARAVVSDVAAGAVVVVSPQTQVFDVLDPAPCDEARALGAALVFRTMPPPEKTVFPSAVRQFTHCGPLLYGDEAVKVVAPSSP